MPEGAPSTEEASKQVLQSTLQYPVTLYSTGVGLLGGLGTALFGGWVFPALAAGGLLVGGGSWAFNYFARRDKFMERYAQDALDERARQNDALLENVKKVFVDAGVQRCAPEISKQGLQQLRLVQDRYKALSKLLEKRLDPGELSYSRFQGTAQQVYFSVLDNLQQVSEILEAACGIDTQYIAEREAVLKKQKQAAKADRDEKASLERRRQLQSSQYAAADELLAKNEEALTQLEATNTRLAAVRTKKGLASTEMEEALRDLQDLAGRSQRLSLGK
jgi:hypothetical protein